jgi:acyl-coenzyme A synthetase/AMP-(fatty) acid ligase
MMWNFKQYTDNVAVISEQVECITYQQLDLATERLIENINERCLVFSLCTNSVGAVVGYTGFVNHNIVPLLLDSHLDFELLQYLINIYKPSYLWMPESMTERFSGFDSIYSDFNYTLMKTNFDHKYPLFDELALLLTTSGSTGSPKLVRQSYKNIEANIKSIVEYLKLDQTERPITTLPMNYTYGLSIVNSHLYVGATLLLTDKTLMEKGFWSFFKEQEATSFGGVPYTYEMLDKLRFLRMGLVSLRTMTQAGGKLSPELHKKFAEYAKETGKHFIVMYGQTEATARMSYLPYEKSLEKCGSMGIAIPGGKFTLIDVDGNVITEPEVTGKLVYEGPNVTLGYAECGDDLIKCDECFGKLITGDMAKIDEEGYYYIVGRTKRFLKIFGNRVNLDEIERMIKAQFNNLDCASAGMDDKMYIFISCVDEFLETQVKKFLSDKTGLNPAAFIVKQIEKIPKNESGKTLYVKLERYYE